MTLKVVLPFDLQIEKNCTVLKGKLTCTWHKQRTGSNWTSFLSIQILKALLYLCFSITANVRHDYLGDLLAYLRSQWSLSHVDMDQEVSGRRYASTGIWQPHWKWYLWANTNTWNAVDIYTRSSLVTKWLQTSYLSWIFQLWSFCDLQMTSLFKGVKSPTPSSSLYPFWLMFTP